jgi:hypothetical protein
LKNGIKIRVHGELSIPEIKQALFEQLAHLEENFSVRYSLGATLYINPSNGFGDRITPRDNAGGEVEKLHCRGPYRSAADEYKL